jgi:hypothetical protein
VISRSRLFAGLCTVAALAAAVLATPVLAAAPAWSPIPVSGPTNLPPVQSETQRLGIDAEAGTFTLAYPHVAARGTGDVQTTSAIANVATTAGTFAVGQEVQGLGVNPGTEITGVVENEPGLLTLFLSKASFDNTSSVSLLATDGDEATTGPLAFDAAPTEVEAALNALAPISAGGGRVSVSGGLGGRNADHPYLLSFSGGDLADVDLPQLSADSSGLTGGSAHSASVSTVVPGGLGTGEIALYAENVGGLSSSGPITASMTLPPGIITSFAHLSPQGWSCNAISGQQTVTCETSEVVGAGLVAPSIKVPIVSTETSSGVKMVEVSVSGGGAASPASYQMPLTISSTPAEPGYQTFTAGAYDADGLLDHRAGGHPYSASSAIFVNTHRSRFGEIVPVGEPKDINVDLPPGFLGNPEATPQCPEANLAKSNETEEYCPPNSIVGRAGPVLAGFGDSPFDLPVYNVEAPFGYPGKFFFEVVGVPIHAVGSLRSDEDYGLTVSSLSTAQIATVYGSFFTFWGSPGDPSHDAQRCNADANCPKAFEGPTTSFLTSPVDCSLEAAEPPVTRLRLTLWQSPLVTHTAEVGVPPVTECDKLHFESAFSFQPSGAASADSPAAFTTNLTVPSEGLTNPEKLTTPEAKTTVVHFPKGVVLNPSAADGLSSCSEAEIGLKGTDFPMPNPVRFDKEPNTCPESSKIGTLEIKTPLLANPLHGALYLAKQGENPFGSLFAVYLVIEDPRTGVFIKLPGDTEPDPTTGQITASFEDLPQLPFESLKLSFKGGSRAPFATPTTCGDYDTTTVNTPWSAPESGPPFETHDSFDVGSGPGGGPCADTPAQRPFNLGFNAGSANATAGAHSPFNLQITRPDGAQEMSSLQITTPAGFTASLKGVPYCTEAEIRATEQNSGRAEQTNPSCPAASQVGTDLTGAGSGANPYYAPGKVYLAGPYKGAPLSVVAVTPAVAGPFDLGTVVVRAALHVNPETAQITASTDQLPEYLKGVALRIRDIRINLDRPDWALNPTNCAPKTVAVSVKGNSGATANLSTPFQVSGCEGLAFKPKLMLSLKGGTRRNTYPALTATLTQKPGQANIDRVAVTLPHSEFLEQGHIGTVCTRVQFNTVPRACPARSIYGYAEAESPLLDYKLSGPVYLRSSEHKLPDLVAALQGPASQPIEVDLDGRIDSKNGGIRNSFEVVPDAPVSKFVLRMQGGKKGLLVNSTNLCTAKPKARRATVRIVGQNAKRADQSPLLTNQCHQHKKHQPKKGRHHRRTKSKARTQGRQAHRSALLRQLGIGW